MSDIMDQNEAWLDSIFENVHTASVSRNANVEVEKQSSSSTAQYQIRAAT